MPPAASAPPHEVLHLLGTAQPEGTGVARIVAALAAGLDPGRFRTQVWFTGGDGPLAAELARAGVAVRVLPWRGARDPAGAYRCWRALRASRFALVHQHAGGRTVRWLVRAATRAKLVAHLHAARSESGGSDPVAELSRGADAVVATSGYLAERARARTRAPVRVVYPGVPAGVPSGVPLAPSDPPRGRRADRPPLVVGTAARLVPLKGLHHLVRAFAQVGADLSDVPDLLVASGTPGGPGVRLEIAGDGPQRDQLEREVARLGLSSTVTFLGWQPQLAAVFPRWDLFVLPSLEEAFGIAALEAMAAGLPVIASRTGGLPELIEHGRHGRLVPPGDEGALARAVRDLLRDGTARRAMGQAAARRAAEFNCERMVAGVAEVYDAVLGQP